MTTEDDALDGVLIRENVLGFGIVDNMIQICGKVILEWAK